MADDLVLDLLRVEKELNRLLGKRGLKKTRFQDKDDSNKRDNNRTSFVGLVDKTKTKSGGWGRIANRVGKTQSKIGRILSAREEEKAALALLDQNNEENGRNKKKKRTAAAAAAAIIPSRPASIRARLYSHMDEIRSSPVARAKLIKVAKEHLQEVAQKNHELVQWNIKRAKVRQRVVCEARVQWIDQNACRVSNSNLGVLREQKWWTLIRTASVLIKVPQIIAQAKAEKQRRLERALRRRQRMRRRVQGLGGDDNQAAAAAATINHSDNVEPIDGQVQPAVQQVNNNHPTSSSNSPCSSPKQSSPKNVRPPTPPANNDPSKVDAAQVLELSLPAPLPSPPPHNELSLQSDHSKPNTINTTTTTTTTTIPQP